MKEPDFASNEQHLIEASIRAIREFAEQHPDEVFNYFAFDCNADYGEILLCLDTSENSIARAKEHEEYMTEHRHQELSYDESSLEWAIDTVTDATIGPVLPFNNNTGDFQHQGFAEVSFLDEWQTFRFDDDYPGQFEDSEQDYLESKATVMLSKAIDALIDRGAFNCLRRSSPFLVGFAFHDGPQVIVRIQNW
ncbi:MAG: hypothetical protein ABFD16_26630 [Thermoguttaceae bacterium]|jgi:hypothetical protein